MSDLAESVEPAADIESRADVDKPEKPQIAKFWLGEIAASKTRSKTWIERAGKVVARFRDERDMTERHERRANILWSNTEILKSALFQRLGSPDVRRRFPRPGREDKVARQVGLVIERGISFTLDAGGVESHMEACVEDMVLPGRGTAWVVYSAEVSEDGSHIASQNTTIEHVYYQDFLQSAGRKWADVWWVARGHDYSRDEMVAYFGEKHGRAVPLNVAVMGYDNARKPRDEEDTFKRARVWEIWDKTKRERVYVAEGYRWILRKEADPYKLENFFPTVEPLVGIKTTSSLDPIPEYTLYQDQAEELDQITTRLNRLIDALRRRGVYDAGADGEDQTLAGLAQANDNQFLPMRNWASFLEKGGLKGAFQTEDLSPIVAVVQALYQQRQTLVQTIYEVTGISDVIRGSTNPNETATAQAIKGRFGSLRLQKRQAQVQRFIRDLIRLVGEVIAEHYTREVLQDMTGIELPLVAEVQAAKQQLAMLDKAMVSPAPGGMPPASPQLGHNGGPPMDPSLPPQSAPPALPAPPAPEPLPGSLAGSIPNNHTLPPEVAQLTAGSPPMPAPDAIAGSPPPQAAMPMSSSGPAHPMPPMPGGAPPMGPTPQPPVDPDYYAEVKRISEAIGWEEIEDVLRSDKRRGFKVSIETDATNAVNSVEEKNARIEFVQAMQGFLERTIPGIMQVPQLAPLARELCAFGLRAFPIGRTLEESFDDAFAKIEEAAKSMAGQPPPPNPEVEARAAKAKAEAEALQQRTQAAVQTAQVQAQLGQQKLMQGQQQMQMGMAEAALRHQQAQADAQATQVKAASDAQVARQKASMDAQKMHMDMRLAHQKAGIEQMRAEAEMQKIGTEQALAQADAALRREDAQMRADEMRSRGAERQQAAAIKAEAQRQKMAAQALPVAAPLATTVEIAAIGAPKRTARPKAAQKARPKKK